LESDRQALHRDRESLAEEQARFASQAAEKERVIQQRRTELAAVEDDFEAGRQAMIAQQDEVQNAAEDLKKQRERLQSERAAWEASQAAEASRLAQERHALEDELTLLAEKESQLTDREAALSEQQDELLRSQQAIRENQQSESEQTESLRDELRRLIGEVNHERQTRLALETELDASKNCREVERAQWESERAAWNATREELERSIADLTTRLADLEAELYRQPNLDDVEELSRDVASVDAPSDAFSGEDEEQLDESVSHLRAELAKMFDLSGDVAARAEEPTISAVEPEPPEQPIDPDDHWRRRLESILTDRTELPSEPFAEIADDVAAAPELSDPQQPVEEEESIADYMERLLARTRRGAPPALDDEGHVSQRRRDRYETSREHDLSAGSTPATDATAEEATDVRRRSAQPRSAPDKDAIREHLETFREVANLTARTAVAKHASKTLRITMAVKGAVALLCIAASGGYLFSWQAHGQAHFPHAMVCLIMAGVVAGSLVKNLVELRSSLKRTRLPAATRTVKSPPPRDDDAV
jgi:hypothetical protein